MSAGPPDELEFFLALTLAASKASVLVTREFQSAGVEMGNWGLLAHIAARETMTPSRLADEIGVSMPTIRDQLQGLVDRGLVKRVPNPLDGRSYFVVLTAAGRTALRRGTAASARAQAALAREYGPLEPLRKNLVELVRSAGAAADHAEREAKEKLVDKALRRR